MTPPYYVDIEVLEKLKEYRYTPRKSGYETLFWCDEQGVDYAQQDCTATKFFPIIADIPTPKIVNANPVAT